ncbi:MULTISPECIES: AraC family transcriptional regulator [Photobacterium]|uniref:HTH-type transcriptional activator RhaS n=1 Tax=Photobacterium malacitanum TaxID=2204294 RepID=A0A1Y6M4I5_9GAMM|nr:MULTISPECIES: helix-turn-helix domain-containing protein [Photobacterium]SMY31494.1 HTH-type transcriptional activator RhaS [Photobacterium malacitanum]
MSLSTQEHQSIQRIAFNSQDCNLVEITLRPLRTLLTEIDRYPLTTPHRLDFYSLIYINHGEGLHMIDTKPFRYQPGSLFLIARHQIHHFILNEHSDGYVMTFTDNMLFAGADDTFKPDIIAMFEHINHCHAPDLAESFAEIYAEFQSRHPHRNDMLHCLLRSLIHRIYRANLKLAQFTPLQPTRLFDRFRAAVEQHFHQHHHVAEYANLLGCSSKKLGSVCKQQTGLSAKRLIDDRLLLEAKRLLAYTFLSIGEIAIQLGFEEATNLAKFFRRHTELSPRDFRSISRLNYQQNGQMGY